MADYHPALVILLGIASTTQTHLAKALERQGIETFDLVRDRLKGTHTRVAAGQGHKPLIYFLGLALNHTTFIYHLFIAPLGGTAAQYTSMYGAGLVVLLLYSTVVMKEHMSPRELAGGLVIVLGTLAIGLDGIVRPPLDMAQLPLGRTITAVVLLLAGCAVLIVAGLRSGSLLGIGLAFGLGAGTCGSLDPFLKAVGQTAGGGRQILPGAATGWIVLVASFLVGEAAVLVTQWGFYRRARANILVPAYNCSYIAVPVVLQALLLPGFRLHWATSLGLGLVMIGFVLVRGVRSARQASEPAVEGAIPPAQERGR